MTVYVLAGLRDLSGEAFYRGQVLTVSDDSVMVKLLQGPKNIQEFSASEVFPSDKDAELGISDLSRLSHLHEASLLINLQSRYTRKEIYTFLGPTLITVNPFEYIEDPSSLIEKYRENSDLPPHTFTIAKKALESLWASRKNQAIIISGESGAGKTETTKHALNFLAHSSASPDIEYKLTRCNPLLEAFGNAKTARNDNSSRFGKYLKLFYDRKTQVLTGAAIDIYLLEKNRVIWHASDERNFHIFYHLVKGAPDELKQRLGLLDIKAYKYLAGASNIGDSSSFQDVKSALEATEFTPEEIDTIWRILVIILNVGNIQFDESPRFENENEPCRVIDKTQQFLSRAAELLGLSPDELLAPMVHMYRTIGGSVIDSPLSRQNCETYRDSFAKFLYERLFIWIVSRLNDTLRPSEEDLPYIGLLDIFGFECFKKNSLEQFCINYTNEKLQQLYVHYVFKQEEEAMEEDGLGDFVSHIDFSDNSGILDLLEGFPVGMFNLIDEACAVKSDDVKLLANMIKHHSSNDFFEAPQVKSSSFTINHTPRDVEYLIEGFRGKNMDELRKEMADCALKDDTIAEIYKNASGAKFLGAKFRKEMSGLMKELGSCGCHFIRCIKPNEQKKPWNFSAKGVLVQVQYLGLLDSIAVRRQGFPVRFTYEKFCRRYEELHPIGEDWQNTVEDFVDEFLPGVDHHFLLFGRTQVFMKEEVYLLLESILSNALKDKVRAAVKIQSLARRFKSQKAFKVKKEAAGVIKRNLQMFSVRKKYIDFKEKTIFIQKWYKFILYKELIAMRNFGLMVFSKYLHTKFKHIHEKKILKAAQTGQRLWRGHKGRRVAQNHKLVYEVYKRHIFNSAWIHILVRIKVKCAKTIQRVYRGHLCRTHHSDIVSEFKENIRIRNRNKAATLIQKNYKGFKVRNQISHLHKSARIIQNFIRTKRAQKLFKQQKQSVFKIQKAMRSFTIRSKIVRERLEQFLATEITPPIHVEPKGVTYIHNLNPYYIEKLHFFSQVLDVDELTDTSLIYEKGWNNCIEGLTDQLIQKQDALIKVEVGSTHSIGISSRGKIFTWGWNDCSQCLHSNSSPRHVLHGQSAVDVSCGDDYSLVLNSEGKVYAFGDNSKGQLGQGHYSDIKEALLLKINNVASVHTAGSGNVIVTKNNEVYKWPYENSRQEKRSIPKRILESVQVLSLSMGLNFTLILATSGLLYACGDNRKGQLGLGDCTNKQEPEIIHSLKKEKVDGIACGPLHSLCKTTLGKTFTWGWGEHGQLGQGEITMAQEPKQLSFKDRIVQIGAGWRHSVFMNEHRNVFWTGRNGSIDKKKPVIVDFNRKIPEFFDDSGNFAAVKIETSWSRSLSVTCVVICDTRCVSESKVKINSALSSLAIKWTGPKIHPPVVDTLVKYYPAISMPKQPPAILRSKHSPTISRSKLSPTISRSKHSPTISRPQHSPTTSLPKNLPSKPKRTPEKKDKIDIEHMKMKFSSLLTTPESTWTEKDKSLIKKLIFDK